MKVIDKTTFIETFGYFDKSIVREIIDIFTGEYTDRLDKIKNGIEKKDFSGLKFEAHSMKGVISNFMAPLPQNIARSIEIKADHEDFSQLPELFQELEIAIFDLVDDLKMLRTLYEE